MASWGMQTTEMKVVSSEYDYTVSVDKYKTWDKLYKAANREMRKQAQGQVDRMRKGESLEDVTRDQSEIWHNTLTKIASKMPGTSYTRTKV